MSEYDLTGSKNAIALNESESVGVFAHKKFNTNQTRSTLFTPEYLLEWAKAVNDAYEDEPAVEVVFTPKKPIVAKANSDDADVGIGLAPRLMPEDYEEIIGESE